MNNNMVYTFHDYPVPTTICTILHHFRDLSLVFHSYRAWPPHANQCVTRCKGYPTRLYNIHRKRCYHFISFLMVANCSGFVRNEICSPKAFGLTCQFVPLPWRYRSSVFIRYGLPISLLRGPRSLPTRIYIHPGHDHTMPTAIQQICVILEQGLNSYFCQTHLSWLQLVLTYA